MNLLGHNKLLLQKPVGDLQFVQWGDFGGYYPTAVFFSPNGVYMYIPDFGYKWVNQYELSTPWDISTAVYLEDKEFTDVSNFRTLKFNLDGSRFYILDGSGDDIYQFDCSTPWRVSTASALNNGSDPSSTNSPTGFYFKANGLSCFFTDATNIKEYTLSTAWNVNTLASSYTKYFYAEEDIWDLHFTSDGLTMYTIGTVTSNIFVYDLTTAWDITTCVLRDTLLTGDKLIAGWGSGMFIDDSETHLYIFTRSYEEVAQFKL